MGAVTRPRHDGTRLDHRYGDGAFRTIRREVAHDLRSTWPGLIGRSADAEDAIGRATWEAEAVFVPWAERTGQAPERWHASRHAKQRARRYLGQARQHHRRFVPLDPEVHDRSTASAWDDALLAHEWQRISDRLACARRWLSARQQEVVRLLADEDRTQEYAAAALRVSPSTVKREWRAARASLSRDVQLLEVDPGARHLLPSWLTRHLTWANT